MGEKVTLCLYLTAEEDRRFRQFLADRYKTIERGLISHEIASAMDHWVKIHTNTQKLIADEVPNPLPKVSIHYMNLKRYLLSKYYHELIPGTIVPWRYFTEAVQNTRGSDARTIKKWTRIFMDNGLVKNLGSTVELVA